MFSSPLMSGARKAGACRAEAQADALDDFQASIVVPVVQNATNHLRGGSLVFLPMLQYGWKPL